MRQMRRPLDLTVVLAAAVAVMAAAATALTAPMGTDYAAATRPAIDALLRGDLSAAMAQQPQMGPLSVLLRWPAGLLAEMLGGGPLWVYRAGALVCLLAAVVLFAVLVGLGRARAREERRCGDPRAALILVLIAVLVANPVIVRALELGHPEEILGSALCVAAVLLALGRRAAAAGIALGLALATKQWALLAVVPAALAAPPGRDRVRLTMWAGGVAALCTLPPLVADPQAFFGALNRPATGLHELRPGNLWSLILGPSQYVDLGSGATQPVTFVPAWLRPTAHPGVAVAGFALGLLWLRRRREGRAADILALLALIMLVRCVVDPWNHEYYHLPFLTALAAWEVVACRRAPVLAAASSALLWLVFARLTNGSGASGLADAIYVTWAVLALAALTRAVWWPRSGGARVPQPAVLARS